MLLTPITSCLIKHVHQTGKGRGVCVQTHIVTKEEDNNLWENGPHVDATPQSLLNTVVLYNGLYFALRNGKENWQLKREPCQ